MKKLAALFVGFTLIVGCGGGGGSGGGATNGSSPAVNLPSATSISTNGVTLNGNVTPNGLSTQAWFEYGTDSLLTINSSTTQQPIGSGLSNVPVSVQITGLAGNTKYYFRVCAANAKGESESTIDNFTTASSGSSPLVTTLSATSVGATTATLNSYVGTEGLATNVWFEYGTDPNLASSTSTSSQSVTTGLGSRVLVTAPLSGLSSGTYYFRPVAINGAGTHTGNIVSFTTGTQWAITGSMAQARPGGGATLLLSGKVLVAGGRGAWNDNTVPSSAELYDPATGTWSPTGMLNAARMGSAALLPNGNVLVAGGFDLSNNTVLSSAELYNPATGTWSFTGSMATVRGGNSATLLLNGKVLIAGGTTSILPYYTFSTELYDPATGTWDNTGSKMQPSIAHTATLLPNGKVLVAGGGTSAYPGDTFYSSAELYDPASGTWSYTGSMAYKRRQHTATLLQNGKVLVTGGVTPLPNGYVAYLSSAELYDPATGTWTSTGSMVEVRIGHAATLLPNGMVLVAGGIGDSAYLSSVELYDPVSGTWSYTGSMAEVRYGPKTTLLQSGKVLVVGGENVSSGTQTPLASAEVYTP